MIPADMVYRYIKLRDHKKARDDEHKKEMERVNLAMEKLEGMMLSHMIETGATSIGCDAGTVYRSEQVSATVQDRDTFFDWCLQNNLHDAMDVKANKTFVKEFVAEKGEVPPGVKYTSVATVGVRRS